MDLPKWVSFPEPIVFKDPEPLCEGSNHKFLQSAKAGDYDTFERLLRQCPDLDVNFVEDPRCPQQGCNSIDIFIGPESSPELCPKSCLGVLRHVLTCTTSQNELYSEVG